MGVLYFAQKLALPSHLWMRRMLEGLTDCVALVVSDRNEDAAWPNARVLRKQSSIAERIARRVGLGNLSRWHYSPVDDLLRLATSDAVSTILIHYLTTCVKYESVWEQIDRPVFVHCHGQDATWDLRQHERPGVRAHCSTYIERICSLPENVHLIANSYHTRSRLEHIGFPLERVQVKYLGVEVDEEPPIRPLSDHSLVVLYLGNLVDCKGPDLTIRAFALACERGLDARLIIAGDGPLRVTCELERARSTVQDRIEIIGAVDHDKGRELRAMADIFTAHNCRGLLTRQEEAFGVAIVEAMAAALPVVCGNCGAIPEIVENGKQGILFEPEDIDAHAEALIQLAEDLQLRRAMGHNGWERARNLFTKEREIDELRRILRLPKRERASGAGLRQ